MDQSTEEAAFLAEYDPRAYDPVGVAVDTVALTLIDGRLNVLAVKRREHPFRGLLALPGTFLRPERSLEVTAVDAVRAKANISPGHLEQIGTFAGINRDPRMRVISVAYLAFGPTDPQPESGWVVGRDVVWLPVFHGTWKFAFDHEDIVEAGVKRAQDKLEYTALATTFLPEEFTMSDLREVYEAVWNRPIDPANFYRKVLGTKGFVEPIGTKRRNAALFRAGDATKLFPAIRRDLGAWS